MFSSVNTSADMSNSCPVLSISSCHASFLRATNSGTEFRNCFMKSSKTCPTGICLASLGKRLNSFWKFSIPSSRVVVKLPLSEEKIKRVHSSCPGSRQLITVEGLNNMVEMVETELSEIKINNS
uniref:Uncharacterized protein n=1 Tax=Timema cristinae TaxID=61476 RepID=A0A7R9CFJ0_TIMCR|nr:unnamed protein product [Timema cristinae]